MSLLELLLVMGIVATLSAIAIPRYGASLTRYRADLAARRIIADLTLARSRAKATSASQTVMFFPSANAYYIPTIVDPDRPSIKYAVSISGTPYRATLVSVDLAGDDNVVFDGWGLPDSGGEIHILVGSESRTISIDSETGKATLQDIVNQ